MSLKLHYVSDHMDKFPSNCRLMSDQQGERFHKQLFFFERIYNKALNSLRMLADYCCLGMQKLIGANCLVSQKEDHSKQI